MKAGKGLPNFNFIFYDSVQAEVEVLDSRRLLKQTVRRQHRLRRSRADALESVGMSCDCSDCLFYVEVSVLHKQTVCQAI